MLLLFIGNSNGLNVAYTCCCNGISTLTSSSTLSATVSSSTDTISSTPSSCK
jgi:hypothetical protein